VLLSKRANVFYLEHARVVQMDGRIVYLSQDPGRTDLPQPYFNIPECNTAFVLLGKGTSITDAAARRLAEANVIVGFCGSGGSPLFGALDLTFLAPQSEYRPTEYMQRWMMAWLDEPRRISMARALLQERIRYTVAAWAVDVELQRRRIEIPSRLIDSFLAGIAAGQSSQDLLLAEARWARGLYGLLAGGFGIEFTRTEGEGASSSPGEVANSQLDHGNYIAYGYASVVLCGLGISFALPLLHGKTRRGALVFDVADLIKDAYVMPMAFAATVARDPLHSFREALIERCQDCQVLDHLFTFIASLPDESHLVTMT
jgi:CRISPR-associated protein Cas1